MAVCSKATPDRNRILLHPIGGNRQRRLELVHTDRAGNSTFWLTSRERPRLSGFVRRWSGLDNNNIGDVTGARRQQTFPRRSVSRKSLLATSPSTFWPCDSSPTHPPDRRTLLQGAFAAGPAKAGRSPPRTSRFFMGKLPPSAGLSVPGWCGGETKPAEGDLPAGCLPWPVLAPREMLFPLVWGGCGMKSN